MEDQLKLSPCEKKMLTGSGSIKVPVSMVLMEGFLKTRTFKTLNFVFQNKKLDCVST